MSYDHKVCTHCGYVGEAKFATLRLSKSKCPKCTRHTMVALRSPEGRNVLAGISGQPRIWVDTSNEFEQRN